MAKNLNTMLSYTRKKFKMAITRLYIAKSRILRRNSIRMHKSSPRNMLQILATQIGHVLYST